MEKKSSEMQDQQDLELVRALQAGIDVEKNTGRLVERFQPVLKRYLWRRWRKCPPETADDIIQETFIKIWKNINSFRGDSTVIHWVWAIAGNALSRHHQHQNGLKRAAANTVALGDCPQIYLMMDPTPDPLDTVLSQERVAAINAAVARLSPRRREALLLRAREGFSLIEIAGEMGISKETVKPLLSQARDILRRRLLNEEGNEPGR